MKKLCVLMAVVLVMMMCVSGFAHERHDHEERYIREEAARRNITLITESEAKAIAARLFGSKNVRFDEVELDEESDGYPNAERFRPVYQIECKVGRDEYDVDIDAVTGEVLKFERDD